MKHVTPFMADIYTWIGSHLESYARHWEHGSFAAMCPSTWMPMYKSRCPTPANKAAAGGTNAD
jgi:hypothetical protein